MTKREMCGSDANDIDDVALGAIMREALEKTIQLIHERAKKDVVARALLYLLVRVANTRRTIDVLWQALRDAYPETFMVDGGTLLRAMFDAYLQAAFITYEPGKQQERASLYLDFEHIKKRQLSEKLLKHDTMISRTLKDSPLRPEGEQRVKEQYDRVKDRYPGNWPSKWYQGNLWKLAKDIGMEADYDLFVSPYNGCVHSSADAVRLGPPMSPEHICTMISIIASRMVQVALQYMGKRLEPSYQAIIDANADAKF